MQISSAAASLGKWCTRALLILVPLTGVAVAQSVYQEKPNDALAVDARPGSDGLHGDGTADDADALQAAIDRVEQTTGGGIVFLREGRYRLSHTVYLWSGIRLIGYGAHRPTLVLADNTPGFQEGHGFLGTGRYMLQFASQKPRNNGPIVDANEFTFYSGLSNVDFEIGKGNPAAIAIRFHVAQHSFLSHLDIRVGDGRAGLEDVGNQAHDLTIEGGEYGIISKRTSPAWQFLLMDSHITGQRVAAIHTEEVGMTLLRVELAHTPVAIEISQGMPEQLYARDLLLRDIKRTAIVLGDISQQHHEVTLQDIRCADVPHLLEGGELASGWTPIASPSRYFMEESLSLGREIGLDGREEPIALRHRERRLSADPKLPATDIPVLPPVAAWKSVKDLGVVADGVTDDTAALQKAVDTQRVLYLPSGVYHLRGTLHLRPDTVLIGLNPSTTIFTGSDDDANFMGAGDPVPLLESPAGGATILTGFSVATGNSGPRIGGVIWRAGAHSLIDDVNFPAGRNGAFRLMSPGSRPQQGRPAQSQQQRPPQPPTASRKGTQSPSLWIRDGGGGLLRDVWTANTMARAGLRIENTTTPGIAYQVSCEHHPANEVQLINAAHWTIYALQTEEEMPDGAEATPVELDHAQDTTFANLFDYRVSRNIMPKLAAVVSRNSSGVRLENMHNFSQTRLAFDNSVIDETSGVAVRTHDFTTFTIGPALHVGAPLPLPAAAFAGSAKLHKLADGFSNATGLTAGPDGTVFFTDSVHHNVYRWDEATQKPVVLTDQVNAPQVAGFVAPSTVLVIDNAKHVFAVPADASAKAQEIQPQPETEGTTLLLPVGLHDSVTTLKWLVEGRGYVYAPRSNMAVTAMNDHEPRTFYYAPGTTTAIEGAGAPGAAPVAGPRGAAPSIGTWKPDLQAMQLAAFAPGASHLAASEEDDKVYRVHLESTTELSASTFAPVSGTSVVEDSAGNVYVAGGQVSILNSSGRPIGTVEIPERPTSLAFGGRDGRTLFIGARSGVYAIQTLAHGR